MLTNIKDKDEEIEFFQIVIPKNTSSIRIDKFLSDYSGYSRSRISNYTYKLFINKKEEKLSKLVKPDDIVEVYLKLPADYTEIIPQSFELQILYEDEFFLIINKPFGVPTHPSFGHPSNTILNYIKFYLMNKKIDPLPDCGMVHRLDKDTEGILIFAKTIESQLYLKSLFMDRKINKSYFAILNGSIRPDSFQYIDMIKRDPSDRLKYKVSLSGKEAILYYSCIGKNDNFSAVNIDLKTGRTHQIRVQFSHRGYFVIGDPIYGKKQGKLYEKYGMLLLSKKLSFNHPIKENIIEIEIELPDRFIKFLNDNSITIKGK